MYESRDVMTTDILAVSPDMTVKDAINCLVHHRVSGAPVVDAAGRLVGVITEFQLLEAIFTPEVKKHLVGDFMTKDVLTVTENTMLSDVAHLFITHRIRRVPVVRDDRIVGIVSRHDLLRYILEANDTLDEFLDELRSFATV